MAVVWGKGVVNQCLEFDVTLHPPPRGTNPVSKTAVDDTLWTYWCCVESFRASCFLHLLASSRRHGAYAPHAASGLPYIKAHGDIASFGLRHRESRLQPSRCCRTAKLLTHRESPRLISRVLKGIRMICIIITFE